MSNLTGPHRLISVGLFLFLTPLASADMLYTSQAAFEAQAGPLTQVTFTGFTNSTSCQADSLSADCFAFEGGTFSNGGLTFNSVAAALSVADPAFLGPDGPFSLFGTPVLADTSSVSNIVVQLPAGTRSAGLQLAYSGLIQPTTSATISLSDGTTQVFSLSGTSPGFIGFIATSPVASFTLDGIGGGGFETPLVEFASSIQAVPEPPQSGLLLFSVLIGYFAFKSRKFSKCSVE